MFVNEEALVIVLTASFGMSRRAKPLNVARKPTPINLIVYKPTIGYYDHLITLFYDRVGICGIN